MLSPLRNAHVFLRFSIISILVLLSIQAVRCIPVSVSDAKQCEKLCSSCNGIVSFVDNRCECNIENNDEVGTECLTRMRRQAAELGFDLISCNQRSARCSTVGSKHSYSKNQIDQVAKYFEEKGPTTGSVFVAPPFNQKSGDCVGSSPSSGQTASAPPAAQPETVSTPEESVSAPVEPSPGPHMVSLQQLPQQYILTAVPSQQLLSSPGLFPNYAQFVQPQQMVSSPASFARAQPQAQQAPQPEVVSSPAAAPSSGCPGTVGLPAPPQSQQPQSPIITQPPETMGRVAAPNPRANGPVASAPSPRVQQVAPPVAQQTLGAPQAVPQAAQPVSTDMQPFLVRALSSQLSQPMLGIPQAIHTIGSTPGISELVGAPAHLLNVFMRRMGFEPMQMASNPGARDNENVSSTVGKDDESIVDNSCVGAENPATVDQQTNPVSGSPLGTSLNPPVGIANNQNQMTLLGQANVNPASGQVSYVPSMAMISSPMVGSVGPYNGFIPQMPTYIVGSPFGLPYMTNNNMGAQTVGAINPSIMQAKSSVDEPSEPNTAQSNPGESETSPQKPKKLCKKSYGQLSSKIARSVRAASDSTSEDKKRDVEIEREYEKRVKLEHKLSNTTTELPKIERTTTQKPKNLHNKDGKGKTTPEKHDDKEKAKKDST